MPGMSGWQRVGVALMVVVLLAPAVALAGIERHSGTVIAFDAGARTLTLGVMGPWRESEGSAAVARMTIAVPASTEIVMVGRSATGGPGGWPGEFIETPADGTSLRSGEFVTVTVRRDSGRLTAERVAIVRAGE